jgi:glyoxylase-like metal-dependent hydrolase (beta-lactamase superfamily II)
VFIAGFPAGPWGTNCYVLATAPGTECVIVDPGMDATSGVADVVRDHRLRPTAVIATHGHLDHVFCVVPVTGVYDTPAWIHPADRHLFTDPAAGLSVDTAAMLEQLGYGFAEPDDIRYLGDGDRLDLAGLAFTVDHAPGHTAGSVMFRTPVDSGDVSELMLSGDVLFAGSIGRTDLPGGDHATMLHTLRTKVLPLDDRVAVLPGHGGQTTVGDERRTNPFLQQLAVPDRESP